MKKILFAALCGLNKLSNYSLLLAAGCAFTACSSDNDDLSLPEGPGSINVAKTPGVLTAEDGSQVLITNAGGYSVSYDEQGRIKSAGSADFSYNPFTISDGSDEQYRDIRQNSYGYITSMKYTDEDDITTSYSMSYDGSGHLTKLSASASNSSFSGTANTVLTWSNGNLQKIVTTSKAQYDGESETETYTHVFSYSSNSNSNPVHQYSPFTAEAFEDFAPEVLFILGYFGVAGDNHPSAVEYTRTRESSEDGSDNGRVGYSFSYTFNNDGTLRWGGRSREYHSGSTSCSPENFHFDYKKYQKDTEE